MKKYIAITLAAALILSSAACKKAPDTDDDTVILAGSDTESAESDVKSPETEPADDLPLIIPEEQVPDEELPADEDADVMPDFTALARPKPGEYIDSSCEKIVDPETDPKAERLIEVHDDALVRETEILRYRTLNFRLWWNEHFSEHQGNTDKTRTDPEFAPTAEQLATIDRYIGHYNAKLP